MNSGMDFLISVFVGSHDGARCGMKVCAHSCDVYVLSKCESLSLYVTSSTQYCTCTVVEKTTATK